jgi:hypothetical protein
VTKLTNGKWTISHLRIWEIRKLLHCFEAYNIRHIPRKNNVPADKITI